MAALASSASTIDAEAGNILELYYFARADSHELLIHRLRRSRLHLPRATYFRRLEHGIRRVAESLPAPAASSPPVRVEVF